MAIVGEDALNERDLQLLKFADIFEDKFLRQSRDEDRSIDEGTLDLAWNLLSNIDTKYLVRLDQSGSISTILVKRREKKSNRSKRS